MSVTPSWSVSYVQYTAQSCLLRCQLLQNVWMRAVSSSIHCYFALIIRKYHKNSQDKWSNTFQLYLLTWDFCFLLNIGFHSFRKKHLLDKSTSKLYSIKHIGEMPLLNKIKSLLRMGWRQFYLSLHELTYWGRNKIAAILQTSFFLCIFVKIKVFEFRSIMVMIEYRWLLDRVMV